MRRYVVKFADMSDTMRLIKFIGDQLRRMEIEPSKRRLSFTLKEARCTRTWLSKLPVMIRRIDPGFK